MCSRMMPTLAQKSRRTRSARDPAGHRAAYALPVRVFVPLCRTCAFGLLFSTYFVGQMAFSLITK